MSVALIAVTRVFYDGQWLRPGTRFSVRQPKDAQVLTLLGRAKAAPPKREPVSVVTESLPEPPKRIYRRKDVTLDASAE